MRMKKSLAFLLLFALLTPTLQDGFNFFKALNRTPTSRVERFNRDGFNRAFKIPLQLSKRLLYEGIKSEKENPEEEFLSILLNWFPRGSKSNDFQLKEQHAKRCIDVNQLFSKFNE